MKFLMDEDGFFYLGEQSYNQGKQEAIFNGPSHHLWFSGFSSEEAYLRAFCVGWGGGRCELSLIFSRKMCVRLIYYYEGGS